MFKTIEEQIKYWTNQKPTLVGPIDEGSMGRIIHDFHPHVHDGRVLDFGCGVGRVYRGLCKLKPLEEYVGLDISKSYLRLFKVSNPEATVIQVEDFKIPLPIDDFDTIICYSVFTHLYPEHMDLILNEFHRVLKPGGIALVSIFELEVVRVPKVHNWIMIARQRFLDLCEKNRLKPIDEREVPSSWNTHQTLFKLENGR